MLAISCKMTSSRAVYHILPNNYAIVISVEGAVCMWAAELSGYSYTSRYF